MRLRLPVLLAAFALFAGCQLTLVNFVVPATVPPGQPFDLAVGVQWNSQNGSGGVVLQVPNGFVVLGTSSPGSLVQNDPALLALYTPEPGHYLASWSRNDATLSGAGTYYAYMRAPAAPTTATFKIALAGRPSAGSWQANSPAGVTQFALITAPTHARPIAVVNVPPTAFAPDAIGLPYGTVFGSLWSTALSDLDGDGDDDLLANDRAFFRGSGNWNEASTGLATPTPLTDMRVAAGDFDGDGFMDIVHGRGAIFFGNGAGAWTPGPSLPLVQSTLGVATGDVNGDGRDDIALGGYFVNHLRVFFGNANRTFTNASTGLPALPDIGGYEVLLRDVTGDGHLDVVWKDVWAGNGLGSWTQSTGLTGNNAYGVDAGDLDGDGLPELVHANGATVVVHKHLGGNAWTVAKTFAPPGRTVMSVVVLDYDRDGKNDLVFGYHDSINGIELQRNLGGLVFAPVATSVSGLPATTATYVNDLAAGDVNDDTFPDLAVVFFGQGTLVYQNRLAGLSAFGEGCAATLAQPPAIAGNGPPTIGSMTFGLQVSGGLPGTFGLAWLGVSRRIWNGLPVLPMPLALVGGAPGCTLWSAPDLMVLGVFDATGAFTWGLPIPPDPNLQRLTLFAQGAAESPGSPGLGLAVTGALAVRID